MAHAPNPWSWEGQSTYETVADGERLEMAQAVAAQQVEVLGAGGLANARARWRMKDPRPSKLPGILRVAVHDDMTQGEVSDATLRAQALTFLSSQRRRQARASVNG